MGGFFPSETLPTAGFFGGSSGGGWTARTVGTAASGWACPPGAANGIALIPDSNGELWRSIDGGATWADTGVAIANLQEIVGAGNTLLLFTATASYRTTDGLAYTGPHSLNFTGLNNFGTAAGDGAGKWVVGSTGSRNTSISTDDGLTWTQHVIFGAGNWVVSFIWDGTHWVGIAGVSGTSVAQSLDGIAWTFASSLPDFFNNTIGFLPGTPAYVAPVFNGSNNSVRVSNTPLGLASATDVDTGIPGSAGLQNVLAGNGKLWVFDNTGLTAGSSDGGATWSQVPLNFQPGDFPTSGFQAYDAINHSFIAAGVLSTSLSTHSDANIS